MASRGFRRSLEQARQLYHMTSFSSASKMKPPTTTVSQRNSSSPDELVAETSRMRPQMNSWGMSVTLGAIAAIVVLCINLALLIWSTRSLAIEDGTAIIFIGSCDKKRLINLLGHLLINILSSLLLTASNNCMQCLTAPTRKDAGRAHAIGKTLEVGVHSLRNLRFIPAHHLLLWALLGLTSVPIHLL